MRWVSAVAFGLSWGISACSLESVGNGPTRTGGASSDSDGTSKGSTASDDRATTSTEGAIGGNSGSTPASSGLNVVEEERLGAAWSCNDRASCIDDYEAFLTKASANARPISAAA